MMGPEAQELRSNPHSPMLCSPPALSTAARSRLTRWSKGPDRPACAWKRRQRKSTSGNRRRKNPAKAGPSRTHVCLRGVGASTCLPTRRRRSQPTPLPRSCARRTYARRLKKARSRVLPGRVGSWTNAGSLCHARDHLSKSEVSNSPDRPACAWPVQIRFGPRQGTGKKRPR
jgi:hypothetical protein